MIVDHLGNKFKTISNMCDAYEIGLETFRQRRERGWTLEEALLTPADGRYKSCNRVVQDHLGNTYESITKMCIKYKISPATFRARLRRGIGIGQALTESTDRRK